MKGNEKLLVVLNQLLADELTAVNQYMVHSEMCDNWGYELLHKAIEKQAIEEMHHAEWLIKRILFLEGIPVVSKLNPKKTTSIGTKRSAIRLSRWDCRTISQTRPGLRPESHRAVSRSGVQAVQSFENLVSGKISGGKSLIRTP